MELWIVLHVDNLRRLVCKVIFPSGEPFSDAWFTIIFNELYMPRTGTTHSPFHLCCPWTYVPRALCDSPTIGDVKWTHHQQSTFIPRGFEKNHSRLIKGFGRYATAWREINFPHLESVGINLSPLDGAWGKLWLTISLAKINDIQIRTRKTSVNQPRHHRGHVNDLGNGPNAGRIKRGTQAKKKEARIRKKARKD